MLRAIPVHIFSKTFSLRTSDSEIATLNVSWLSENGSAIIGGREVRLHREHFLSGAFELELDGAVIARAHKPSAFRNRFEIEIENARVELVRKNLLSRSFVVRRGDMVLGTIRRESVFARSATIDLPDDWPAALQVFVFWLVLIIWKRMDST